MTVMYWTCRNCNGECAEDARPYMDRCHDDAPHEWRRIVLGRCSDCDAKIHVGEGHSRLSKGSVVRGRIGEPSDMITGIARGPTTYRCESCLRTEGPLT